MLQMNIKKFYKVRTAFLLIALHNIQNYCPLVISFMFLVTKITGLTSINRSHL
jgi:hypothetical protein